MDRKIIFISVISLCFMWTAFFLEQSSDIINVEQINYSKNIFINTNLDDNDKTINYKPKGSIPLIMNHQNEISKQEIKLNKALDTFLSNTQKIDEKKIRDEQQILKKLTDKDFTQNYVIKKETTKNSNNIFVKKTYENGEVRYDFAGN